MNDNNEGGSPPRFELVQRDAEHYEVWKADWILTCSSCHEGQQWIRQLQKQDSQAAPE